MYLRDYDLHLIGLSLCLIQSDLEPLQNLNFVLQKINRAYLVVVFFRLVKKIDKKTKVYLWFFVFNVRSTTKRYTDFFVVLYVFGC